MLSNVQRVLLGVGICTIMMTVQTGVSLGGENIRQEVQQSLGGAGSTVWSGNDADIQMNGLKGAWISTVYNIDWPTNPKVSGFQMEVQQQQYIEMLDKLKQMGINAVFVQVRPTSDAFYPSRLLPWSEWLTGEQGRDPGYDPLAFMVEQTHQRGMAFHAWFNPYRVSVQGDLKKLVADHPAKQHPEWVVKHKGKLLFNPGIPEVKDFIVQTIMEVVTRYEIDGIHLDDYFYPNDKHQASFQDEHTYRQYNQTFSNKADWRRDNVNQLIQSLSAHIKAAKPNVKFGISPVGVWRNASVDATGSETKALSSYDNLYADPRTWIQQRWIDYIVPQVYWHIGHTAAPYNKIVDWWSKETAGTGVSLYIGHAAYRLAEGQQEAWGSADVLMEQLDYNEQHVNIAGSVFFSAKNLVNNSKQIFDRLRQYYASRL